MPDTREMRKIMELQSLAGMGTVKSRTIAEELERRKLIELIHYCTSCEECRDADIADHLIANGVTVQQWIPVKKRTPTEADGTVWVCLADVFPYNEKEPYIDAKHDRRIAEAHYSEFSKRWYKEGAIYPDGVVTHWMEKPQPPKEDK